MKKKIKFQNLFAPQMQPVEEQQPGQILGSILFITDGYLS